MGKITDLCKRDHHTVTDEEYLTRLQSTVASYTDPNAPITDVDIYDIGKYSNGIYYPYMVDGNGAPVDGAPETHCRSKRAAIRYIKEHLKGVLADDFFRLRYPEDSTTTVMV